jgi:CheY-like chemotaxis protein
MKILIIENGNMVRYLLGELLYEMGADEVVEFNQGNKAIDYIKNYNGERLSCIFLDISVQSDKDSTFLDELMFHSVYQDIPIFILTDNKTRSDDLRCFKHEICAYINKPFTAKQIRDCVEIAKKIDSSNPFLETHAS